MNALEQRITSAKTSWINGVGEVENTHLQQFLFLIILLMLIAAGVQGLNLIEKPDDTATLHAIAFIGLSVVGCIFAYVLTLQPRTMAATAVAVLSLTAPIFLHAWTSGMGIRAPIIYLWTPPILLTYYVLGFRRSRFLTLAACMAAVFLYVMEAGGELSGYDPANLPLSANNLIVLWLVVICGLAAANAIRERKELTLQFAHERRALLENALADIELAEASQRQFMDRVSGTVASHAAELKKHVGTGSAGTITDEANKVSSNAAIATGMDTRAIAEVSQRMMQALDSAVEQTERETRFFLEEGTQAEK